MHKSILDATIASVRRRDAQGDCPTEPPHSVEHLEGALLSLALQTRYSETAQDAPGADWRETERNDYVTDAQARELFGTEDDEALPEGRVRVCDGEWVRIPGGYYFDKSAGPLHPEVVSEACDHCTVTIAPEGEAAQGVGPVPNDHVLQLIAAAELHGFPHTKACLVELLERREAGAPASEGEADQAWSRRDIAEGLAALNGEGLSDEYLEQADHLMAHLSFCASAAPGDSLTPQDRASINALASMTDEDEIEHTEPASAVDAAEPAHRFDFEAHGRIVDLVRERDDARKALETAREDCTARDNDIVVLLGNLNWLEQLSGEFLEGDDAAVVSQIGADLKARRAARSASRKGA